MKIKLSFFDIVLSGIIFNFAQLAVLRELNIVIRYSVFALLLLLMATRIRNHYFNVTVLIYSAIFLVFLNFINLYHIGEISFLGISLNVIPIFLLLFSNTINLSNEKKFYQKIFFAHLFILVFAFYKLTFLLIGADYILNENEIACYSFIILGLLLLMVQLTGFRKLFWIWTHIAVTFFISTIMEARAIQFSCVFVSLIFFLTNYTSRFQIKSIKVFSILVIGLPLAIVIFIDELVDFYSHLIEDVLGIPASVIKSELERFDMFSYVNHKIDNSYFGYGIGNTGYMKDISISGLHSGSLDLIYWGGYLLFIIFHLFFIGIIWEILRKNPRLIFGCFLVLYYLILQNYYEGLFFGNMGILIYILSIMTTMIYKLKHLRNSYEKI